jgi:hypothetical protein
MDRYIDEELDEETPQEEVVLSRVNKNQVMYDDVYFNRTRVDIDNIIEGKKEEPIKEEIIEPIQEESYEAKSYSVRDYLEKAHENKSPDNLKREINDPAFKEQEDEIRKLIASIDEKEESEDFFKDLKGDDDNTTIGAKFKTDEFNDSIYETLKSDKTIDENSILKEALGDKTVLNLSKEEDDKMDHTFEKIMIEDEEMSKKRNVLPIVIFCILLFTLILVVAVILLFK